MNLPYYTVDVFTKHQFGGNPLAVFPDASGLSTQQMQLIAREFNLSETAFVVTSNDDAESPEYDIRIFTPQTELPFAGHPTVGTAFILGLMNKINQPQSMIFQEQAGTIPLTLKWSDDAIQLCTFRAPKIPSSLTGRSNAQSLARVLGIGPSHIAPSPFDTAVYTAGVPFGIVPLTSRQALKNISLNISAWQKELQATGFQHLYAVCPLDDTYREWAVRMFAPAMGVMEDPATGAAATAFAGYLAEFTPETTDLSTVTIYQGQEMGRPSTINLDIARNDSRCSSVTVSGECVLTAKGNFYLQS